MVVDYTLKLIDGRILDVEDKDLFWVDGSRRIGVIIGIDYLPEYGPLGSEKGGVYILRKGQGHDFSQALEYIPSRNILSALALIRCHHGRGFPYDHLMRKHGTNDICMRCGKELCSTGGLIPL